MANTGGTGQVVNAEAYATAFGLTNTQLGTFNPQAYDPSNFVSAVLQPRFKAGYVELWSDPGYVIPQGYGNQQVPIKVDYRFQFTGTLNSTEFPAGSALTDVMAVDYDTRQLMEILITVRNYAQTTLPNPQYVTLKATGTIRNAPR
jgi:hypothetical protein